MTAEDFLSYYDYLMIYSKIQHRETFDHTIKNKSINLSIHSGTWKTKEKEGKYCIHVGAMDKTGGCGWADDPEEILPMLKTYESALEYIANLARHTTTGQRELKDEPTQMTIGGIT